jgi:murein L,D-transpeptidase YafK
MMTACGGKANNVKDGEVANDTIQKEEPVVFGSLMDKNNCFIVIDKPALNLSVYEDQSGDTVLIARYPVCVGKNYGQKQKSGDMKTPESTFENPFSITQIQPASSWTHDFGDGRGPILAYGNWFMRLKTPGHKGIGIHGSTNNESSVPGRGSEGCIRLLNDDLDELKDKYAFEGMKVVILKDEQ